MRLSTNRGIENAENANFRVFRHSVPIVKCDNLYILCLSNNNFSRPTLLKLGWYTKTTEIPFNPIHINVVGIMMDHP